MELATVAAAAEGLVRRAIGAVRRVGRAGGELRRAAPDDALRLWHALVGGAWSLVARLDLDGTRFVLARRTRSVVGGPRLLTRQERAVVALAALGHQNKYIGYLLGCSPSSVASRLTSAQRKLGLASRAELIRQFAPLADAPPGASRPRPAPAPSRRS